jgi:hypothetical protein
MVYISSNPPPGTPLFTLSNTRFTKSVVWPAIFNSAERSGIKVKHYHQMLFKGTKIHEDYYFRESKKMQLVGRY